MAGECSWCLGFLWLENAAKSLKIDARGLPTAGEPGKSEISETI